jgi:MinD superfamily P-loop ATPase
VARTVIAVASGKGGTGKTTVAANLARVAAGNGSGVTYLDCDVEEPNGHIFLKPAITSEHTVFIPVPVVDADGCSACGRCAAICRFSAIAVLGRRVVTFPNLCHGCGGCVRVCPTGAITEIPRAVGAVETGDADGIRFVQGRMDIGEAMAPPVIRAVKTKLPEEGLAVMDSPPGTSCPVIQTVRGADYVLLVTEPTPFGLHDLTLAVEMLRALSQPFGVVVNRAGSGDSRVHDYCRAERIELLAEIPDDRRVAEAYSRGSLAVDAVPGFDRLFETLLHRVLARSRT